MFSKVVGPPWPTHPHARCCWCGRCFVCVGQQRLWVCPTEACALRQQTWALKTGDKYIFLPTPRQVEFFEMQRRLPKRGFHNPFREEAYPVNLHVLEKFFEQGGVVDLDAMQNVGVIPKRTRIVKILGSGDVKAALQVKAHRFSKSA